MAVDNAEYTHVNDLYVRSGELNSNINAPYTRLANQLQTRLEQLNRIPHPSSVQTSLINSLEDIIGELAVVEDGTIVGYREVNSQVMIDQIQALRQVVDFDFTHGTPGKSPKGQFRPTINDIQESVYNVAVETGNAEAAEALREANTAYRDWTTRFNNDYINPYRNTANRDFEGLINKNTNPDHFNVLRDLIGNTPEGHRVLGGVQREVVEDKLSKFVKEPHLVRSRDFRKTMTDLESVLTPQQLNDVRGEMEALVPEKFNRRATPKKIEKPPEYKPRSLQKELEAYSREQKGAAKYAGKTTAEIKKLSNTPEGVQQLKKDLSKTPNGKQIFDKLAEKKIKSILSGGKIKPKYTGNDLFEILNKEENYALIESLTSPEEASVALDAAEKLANKKFTRANVGKLIGKFGKYKLIHYLVF